MKKKSLIRRIYELKLLQIQGLGMQCFHCLACGRDSDLIRISFEDGGLYCKDCGYHEYIYRGLFQGRCWYTGYDHRQGFRRERLQGVHRRHRERHHLRDAEAQPRQEALHALQRRRQARLREYEEEQPAEHLRRPARGAAGAHYGRGAAEEGAGADPEDAGDELRLIP